MSEAALTRLARFTAEDRLEADAETVTALRDGAIDALGCIHAGVETDVAVRARAAVGAMSSGGCARVIGSGVSASRPHAAFLNAVAGHALDFDDWEIPGNTHPTVVLLPAMLAVADSGATGRDLARAYLAGFEVIARLGEGLNFAHYDAGWHSTATLGAPGAAAACARLLGLTAAETANAMSLAVSAAAGYTCQFGSSAKPVQAGFAARAGVEAACLARAGLTGRPHVLDHPRGQAALMGGPPPDRLAAALDKLGGGYALTEYGLVIKPWPSCGYTHRIMTCALRLRRRAPPDRIARIDLHLPDFHAAVLPFGQPSDRAEALFSLPFVAAMGLLRGGLTLADMEAPVWTDPEVASLIERTRVRPFAPVRPALNYCADDPDRMIVTLTDGRTLEETCVYPLGAPQTPMSEAQIREKFEANTGLVSGPVPGASENGEARREAWSARLWNWPEEAAVAELFTGRESIR